MAACPTSEQPEWELRALQLEALADRPTASQLKLAETVGCALNPRLPAPVAAVVLRAHLNQELRSSVGGPAEIPDSLRDLEDELGVSHPAQLVTGRRDEVTAWFEARYMLKTARGLRDAQPQVGDVVLTSGLEAETRVVSSIGADGRIYLKGRPPRRAWPNYVRVVQRIGEPQYDSVVAEVRARLRNSARYDANTALAKLAPLRRFELDTHVPSAESVRALEELLDSGERLEAPFQTLLERHPALLSCVVLGGWKTYVIPKPHLGAEHEPDFLVVGVNSVGPQWVTIEIEAPRHRILNKNGTLTGPTRHASQQIQDWREWLTKHIAYAQSEHHLYGLTNRAPGLVIIGRDDPRAERSASRLQSEEGPRIAVHSWDWVLRQAQRLTATATWASDYARENAAAQAAGTTGAVLPSGSHQNESDGRDGF